MLNSATRNGGIAVLFSHSSPFPRGARSARPASMVFDSKSTGLSLKRKLLAADDLAVLHQVDAVPVRPVSKQRRPGPPRGCTKGT